MSKQKKLIELIVQDIIAYIVEDKQFELDIAMNSFYNSSVFEKLQNEETGLYLESSAYLYDLFKTEMEQGKLVQLEV